jgi:hypothetical protein
MINSRSKTSQRKNMKRIGAAGMLAGGLMAAVLGAGASAHADLSDVSFANHANPPAHVPHVDNRVHHSR